MGFGNDSFWGTKINNRMTSFRNMLQNLGIGVFYPVNSMVFLNSYLQHSAGVPNIYFKGFKIHLRRSNIPLIL